MLRAAAHPEMSHTIRRPIALNAHSRADVAQAKRHAQTLSALLDQLERHAFTDDDDDDAEGDDAAEGDAPAAANANADDAAAHARAPRRSVPTARRTRPISVESIDQLAASLKSLAEFHPRFGRVVRTVVKQLRKVEHATPEQPSRRANSLSLSCGLSLFRNSTHALPSFRFVLFCFCFDRKCATEGTRR